MRLFISLSVLTLFASCVPAKKYNELLEREKTCNEALTLYKNSSIDFEAKSKDLQTRHDYLKSETEKLKKDTLQLSNLFRELQIEYDKMAAQNESWETAFDRLRLKGAKETATMQTELEAKDLELQRKEDVLHALENEIEKKQQQLVERERKVEELEEALKRKDQAANLLKTKVITALKGFENQGLSVEQRNGKIYVSLEAKLLFASGSTAVEPNGQKALVQLAKVLEFEKDLEIIVEGHTDNDKLNATLHPKNNWELSVLRATSVVNIMLSQSNMKPAQLMAAGRSEFLPVDIHDKAKNRRIEIIISPNLNELYDIISKE